VKVIIVAGARPNFMKIAPLFRAIDRHNGMLQKGGERIDPVLVHTGQHYDVAMSEVFFRDLGLPNPDVNLEVGSASHAVQTAHIMTRFEEVCLRERPDWVLVVGDVNSTMACTLVAAKMGIRVGHVEAGLRSFDRTMPEEINRIVTDSLADLLFTPSEDADENLIREGIPAERIKRVGNIMIDSLLFNLEKIRARNTLDSFRLMRKEYGLVTIHRPANTDDDVFIRTFMEMLGRISSRLPILFPVHPRTRKKIEQCGLSVEFGEGKNLRLVEPMGYLDFINALDGSLFALTDSGGLQEETTFLQIPCLTLRPNTERPITVTLGTNKLITLQTLEQEIGTVLDGNYKKGMIPDMWDGFSGERVITALNPDAAAESNLHS